MTTHTSGPWAYIDATKVAAMQYAKLCVIKAGDKQIASFSWSDNSPWFPSMDEAQANGRLIAAAPDLLDAAVAFMAIIDPDGDSTDIWAKDMRGAIAKATGSP
ncbi:hypothetical protein ABH944_004821 [Caballeronia udeis]|uniref:Uncharacterized protein n=1 Tax=Caballeronia udeis TaxID=1232866 RepID=A0ABW8MLZ9_9BURK